MWRGLWIMNGGLIYMPTRPEGNLHAARGDQGLAPEEAIGGRPRSHHPSGVPDASPAPAFVVPLPLDLNLHLALAWVWAKLGQPALSTPQSSPSRWAVLAFTFANAAIALGYFSLQSSPVRVRSCARPLSMRAAMRKPSNFIFLRSADGRGGARTAAIGSADAWGDLVCLVRRHR